MPTTADMKAVILVGGPSRGTRFRPLSLTLPKPLFPVAGEPVIYHHMAALSKVPNLREVLLIGFWEPSVFDDVIQKARANLGLHVKYLREYESLGTGGGLFHFRDQILRNSPDAIFVLHADICCAFPLTEMFKRHKDTNALVTLMATKVPAESSTKYGCLVADPTTHSVLHYVEKPESFISDLISCGVFVLGPEIFKVMEDRISSLRADTSNELTTSSEKLSFEQDILIPLAGTDRIFVYELSKESFWRQIKTAASAIPANNLYLEHFGKADKGRLSRPATATGVRPAEIQEPVWIHPSAQIDPSAKIGPYVAIGANVQIAKGCRVRESIILDNSQLQPYATVLQSVVGWSGKIGKWARVEGTPLPGWTTARSGGIWPSTNGVKDQSVTILGENVTVADEVCVRNCTVLPHKELKSSYANEILM